MHTLEVNQQQKSLEDLAPNYVFYKARLFVHTVLVEPIAGALVLKALSIEKEMGWTCDLVL
jgi:hypothetical protein